jgi:hypothetical protein
MISIGDNDMAIAKQLSGIGSFINEKRLIVIIALVVCVVAVTIIVAVLSANSAANPAGQAGGNPASTTGGTEYQASADITIAIPGAGEDNGEPAAGTE